MALTFRQLRYFLVLTEELHFSRAAKRLHISQPPLSASLRQLEEELGVQLLERSSKSVTMTAAGEVFQRQVRYLLEHLEGSRSLVQRVAAGASGILRVGFTQAMIFRQLPTALKSLQSMHPGIELQLLEKNSADLVKAVESGQLDVGFIHAMPLPETLSSLTIANEPFLCCLPINHPLANRDTVKVHDLIGEPLVMFTRSLAPHYYDRLVSLFHIADMEPTIRHEVSQWLTIVALVSQGMGVALVPQALTETMFSNIVFRPLANLNVRHQSLCIWLNDSPNPNRDLLIGCLKIN
tara:strand:+ start:708 stop:1589 length:882 start_codon:yes stop_codon:yes gene_type:complete